MGEDFNRRAYLLPLREVREVLDLGKDAIRDLREGGQLRGWRVGPDFKWRYLRVDVARVAGLEMDWRRIEGQPALVTRKVFQELLGLCDEEVDEGRRMGVVRAWRGGEGRYHRYYRAQMIQISGLMVDG